MINREFINSPSPPSVNKKKNTGAGSLFGGGEGR